EVELAFSGKFETGNVFTLSYLRSAQSTTYAIQNVTKPGIYKVKLPEEVSRYDASLELSSSLPRLTSETTRFYHGVPSWTPSVSPEAKKENPAAMYLGDSPRVVIEGSAYSPIVYTLDGVESRATTDNNGRYIAPLALRKGKTSEFKLKSITNEC